MTKLVLSVVFLLSSISVSAQQLVDYRARTIYFAVTDRFPPSPTLQPLYRSRLSGRDKHCRLL